MQHERYIAMLAKDVADPPCVANISAYNGYGALRSQPLHILQRAGPTEVIEH
jgi:hypothetical protein